MQPKFDIAFTLNGRPAAASVPANASALKVLNETFDLAGAKLACGEGECGACTILVDGLSRNSCLMPAIDMDGRDVLTVEGLQMVGDMDPIQDAFVQEGAVQCGFCTPGMVMQARHLLDAGRKLSEDDVRRGLEGNVCRCTGYKKIIDAIVAASADAPSRAKA
jgi:carbon-monoxide dehydrogenase small subunit